MEWWPTRRFIRLQAVIRWPRLKSNRCKQLVWSFLPDLETDRSFAEHLDYIMCWQESDDDSDNDGIRRYHSRDPKDPTSLLWTDKDFLLSLIEHSNCRMVLKHAAPWLKLDRDVVLAAVQANGRALRYAAHPLREDLNVALAAVRSNYKAFYDASPTLRANAGFVLFAIRAQQRSHPWRCSLLCQVSQALWQDREFILELLDIFDSSSILRRLGENMKSDREIVLKAVRKSWHAIKHACPASCADSEIVLAAARQCSGALSYAAPDLWGDRSFVLQAVGIHGDALEYASEQIKSSKDIGLHFLLRCPVS